MLHVGGWRREKGGVGKAMEKGQHLKLNFLKAKLDLNKTNTRLCFDIQLVRKDADEGMKI